eukprot:gene7346-7414_t
MCVSRPSSPPEWLRKWVETANHKDASLQLTHSTPARNLSGNAEPALSLRGMSKAFGGTLAVDNVSFDLPRGEILALLGQNGAGKSTIIKMLAGVYKPDAGEILINGQNHDPRLKKQSIAFIHQDLGLIEWMSVAENIAMAQGYPRKFGLIDWAEVEAMARRSLAMIAYDIDPRRRISDLTRTEKSLVAIARALGVDAQVLVLDEPTASLPQDDVTVLFKVLRGLKERGVSMIYVSHRLDEIFAISDCLVVLRDGKRVDERRTRDADAENLIAAIIGRRPESLFLRPPAPGAQRLFECQGLKNGDIGPVDFTLHAGEILALVGLRGAGHEAIGRALIGDEPSHSSTLTLRGQPLNCANSTAAVQAGLGFVACDRVAESIATGLSVRENMFINPAATGRTLFSFRTPQNEAAESLALGRDVGLSPNTMCHRALVFRGGTIVAEIPGEALSVESITRATSLAPVSPLSAVKSLTGLQKLVRLAPVYGLPICTLLLILLFSALLPDTFPTMLNLRSILGDKAIIAILSLAAMIPMMAGRIDLTVGYGVVMWHILAIALQTQYGMDWTTACIVVLILGCVLGAINGFLVELAQIDSFIATLGTGTTLYAIAMWYTEGRQVIGTLPKAFTAIYTSSAFGIPIAAFYVIILSLVLWLVTEYLPIGRNLYAIGANPRAAILNGIPTRKYVIGAFIASGFLGALAGIVLAARLRIGQASVGLEFLLPALVGAFLGSTTIKPGRVNVWGTIIGVAILAVGISGIQQLGGAFYVEPLFNGITLLIAIGLAGYAQRKRGEVRHAKAKQTLPQTPKT